jgi:hypothetical protein
LPHSPKQVPGDSMAWFESKANEMLASVHHAMEIGTPADDLQKLIRPLAEWSAPWKWWSGDGGAGGLGGTNGTGMLIKKVSRRCWQRRGRRRRSECPMCWHGPGATTTGGAGEGGRATAPAPHDKTLTVAPATHKCSHADNVDPDQDTDISGFYSYHAEPASVTGRRSVPLTRHTTLPN